jgi:hypothetical protein
MIVQPAQSPTLHATFAPCIEALAEHLEISVKAVCRYIEQNEIQFYNLLKEQALTGIYLKRRFTQLPFPIELTLERGYLINTKWKTSDAKHIFVHYETREILSRSKSEIIKRPVPNDLQRRIPVRSEVCDFVAKVNRSTKKISSILIEIFRKDIARVLDGISAVPLTKNHYYRRKETSLPFPILIHYEKPFICLKLRVARGSFKKVDLALSVDSKPDILVAVSSKTADMVDYTLREYQAVNDLKGCPHIIETFANHYQFSPQSLHHIMIQPWIKTGDLHDLLLKGPLDKKHFFQIAADIFRCMIHMHQMGRTHNDIKPENILVSKDFRAYLTDLSFVYADNEQEFNVCGTGNYMAPEVYIGLAKKLNEKKHYISPERDCFSLGLVLHYAYYSKISIWESMTLYLSLKERDKFIPIVQQYSNSPEVIKEPTDPLSVEHIIWSLKNPLPEDRITAEGALQKLLIIAKAESIPIMDCFEDAAEFSDQKMSSGQF